MTVEIRNLRKGSLHNSMCNRLRHIKMLPCLSIVQALEGAYEVRLDNGSLQRVEAGAAFIAPRYVRQDITHIWRTYLSCLRSFPIPVSPAVFLRICSLTTTDATV